MADVTPVNGSINLGRQGENIVTRVLLPLSDIRSGDGYAVLFHQRSVDDSPYPVTVQEDGDTLIWTVTDADIAVAGRGKAEMRWIGSHGELAKSQVYKTYVAAALEIPEEVPSGYQKYVDAVAENAKDAKDAAAESRAIYGQVLNSQRKIDETYNATVAAKVKAEKAQEKAESAANDINTAKDDAAASAQAAQTAKEAAEQAQTGAQKARTGAETARGKAEEAAQGVAEDREQIGANKSGLEAAQQELTATKEQLAETKAALTTTQEDLKKARRAIQFQAELNQGQTWDFETDDQEAYQRTVPSGAKAGAVMAVGGKSRKGYQILTDDFPATSTQLSVTKKGRYSYVLETLNEGIYRQSGIDQNTPGKAGKYTLHGTINGKGGLIVRFLNINVDKIAETTISATSSVTTINVQNDFARLQLVFIGNNISVPVGTRTEISNIMLESGDTAHPWEPYTPELLSAQVDEVRVVNAAGDSTDTYPIPAAVRNLPGYGWSAGSVANTIERIENGWQYVQRVGSVDLGTFDWYDGGTATSARRMNSRTKPDNVKIPIASSNTPNVICKTYDRISADETWLCTKEGVTINTKNGIVIVYDSQYSTAESLAAFKQHVQGVMLYYELSTPITTDITALMGDALAPFAVEAGGSITLHHPKADEGFAIDVPAKIQYITKLSEVSSNG